MLLVYHGTINIAIVPLEDRNKVTHRGQVQNKSMTIYSISIQYKRDLTASTKYLRGELHTDPNIPLKKMTTTLSLRVLCGCSVHGTRNERVGVLFFSGMWGSVWFSPRRLQVHYVIPRPGVPRHIHQHNLNHHQNNHQHHQNHH